MFGLENSANNFGASAGLLANTLANRPVQAALGTLFIGTDNLLIYRYNGSSWILIGGGGVAFGGATNGCSLYGQAVGLGGILNTNTTVDLQNTVSFTFDNITVFTIGNYTQPTFIVSGGANQIYTYYNLQQKGILLDYVVGQYILGHTGAGNYINVYDDINEIRTFIVGNSYGFNCAQSYVKVGEWSGSGTNLSTTYDFSSNRIANFSGDGYYSFQNVPSYADNTDALSNGLQPGDIYKWVPGPIVSGQAIPLAIVY